MSDILTLDDLVSAFRAVLARIPEVDWGGITFHYKTAMPDTVLIVTPPPTAGPLPLAGPPPRPS